VGTLGGFDDLRFSILVKRRGLRSELENLF
jgi:hypothetical protein